MIIRVPDLKDEVRQLEFIEPAAELNTQVSASPGANDQHFSTDLSVNAEIYRSGHDVHFQGSIDGQIRETCARCLEEFDRPLHREFRFVILPRTAGDDDAEDDEGVDHYSGDDLDLSPLVREQALLSLESLPLCSEECRGLCASCGANLNGEKCACPETGNVHPLRSIEIRKV